MDQRRLHKERTKPNGKPGSEGIGVGIGVARRREKALWRGGIVGLHGELVAGLGDHIGVDDGPDPDNPEEKENPEKGGAEEEDKALSELAIIELAHAGEEKTEGAGQNGDPIRILTGSLGREEVGTAGEGLVVGDLALGRPVGEVARVVLCVGRGLGRGSEGIGIGLDKGAGMDRRAIGPMGEGTDGTVGAVENIASAGEEISAAGRAVSGSGVGAVGSRRRWMALGRAGVSTAGLRRLGRGPLRRATFSEVTGFSWGEAIRKISFDADMKVENAFADHGIEQSCGVGGAHSHPISQEGRSHIPEALIVEEGKHGVFTSVHRIVRLGDQGAKVRGKGPAREKQAKKKRRNSA